MRFRQFQSLLLFIPPLLVPGWIPYSQGAESLQGDAPELLSPPLPIKTEIQDSEIPSEPNSEALAIKLPHAEEFECTYTWDSLTDEVWQGSLHGTNGGESEGTTFLPLTPDSHTHSNRHELSIRCIKPFHTFPREVEIPVQLEMSFAQAENGTTQISLKAAEFSLGHTESGTSGEFATFKAVVQYEAGQWQLLDVQPIEEESLAIASKASESP